MDADCLGLSWGLLVMTRSFSLVLGSEIGIALLANILASGAIVIAKKLSFTDSVTTLIFYSTLGSFILSTVVILWVKEWPPTKDILLLIGISICGVLSNTFYVNALKYGKASLVAPLEYVRLIFAAAMGYLFFQEIPDKYVILGAVVIACSTFLLTRMELSENTFKENIPISGGH